MRRILFAIEAQYKYILTITISSFYWVGLYISCNYEYLC